jgi:hypothetical protein
MNRLMTQRSLTPLNRTTTPGYFDVLTIQDGDDATILGAASVDGAGDAVSSA